MQAGRVSVITDQGQQCACIREDEVSNLVWLRQSKCIHYPGYLTFIEKELKYNMQGAKNFLSKKKSITCGRIF